MLLQGDDNAMRHLENCVFPWRAGMATLGLDSEAVYRRDLSELEFCSNRLYFVNEGIWVFGPKPGKVLAKLGYIINPPKHVSCESMMRGVALGLQKNCNHIPPVREVINHILDLTDGYEAYFDTKNQYGRTQCMMKMKMMYTESEEIRLQMYDQYYYDSICHKRISSSLPQLGGSYTDPHMTLLFDRDTSGLQQIFCAA
jgi:hypothetical protein